MRKGFWKFIAAVLTIGLLAGGGLKLLEVASQRKEEQSAQLNEKLHNEKKNNIPQEEPIVIKVAWWGEELRNNKTLKVIEMFMDENPDIKVEVEFSEFDSYWDTLGTEAALQTMPDVIQQDYKYIEKYALKNLLTPLNEYIVDRSINTEDIAESVMKASMIGNNVYGICLGINTQTMFYHPDILRQAGITLKETMTWEEYEGICEMIFEKTNTYSSPIYINDALRGIELNVRNAGQSLYAKDKKTLGFTDSQLVEDYFALIKRQVDAGISTPLEFNKPNEAPQDTSFIKKIDWNGFGWSNGITSSENILQQTVGAQMIPQNVEARQNSHYMKPAMFFSISEASEVKEAAAKFIDYFTNSIEANKILLGERGVPASARVRAAISEDISESSGRIFDFVSTVEKYAAPIDPPEPAGAVEITEMASQLLDEVLYQAITPKEAAERFMKEGTAILAKNN